MSVRQVCRVSLLSLALGAVGCASSTPAVVAPPPPPPPPAAPTTTIGGAPITATGTVTDTYHGVVVADPYRWLEDGSSDATAAFIAAQNALARKDLDGITGREAIANRLREIYGAATIAYGDVVEVGGQIFAMKFEPPKQQRFLVVMPNADATDKERVVVDPNVIDPTGKTSIEWLRVSPDGKKVALSISQGGSETGDAHIFDVATGKSLEVVPGVNAGTAGGDLGWLPDSSGFYYSRYPRGDERPAADKLFYVQLYKHILGTDTSTDTYEIGRDFPRIAEVFVDVHPSGLAICSVQKGDGGEFMFSLRGKDGTWTQLAAFEDRAVQMFFGEKADLYIISRKDAPRGKLLHAPIKGFDINKASIIIPEQKDALVSDIWADDVLTVHAGHLYAQYQLGGPSELRVFDLAGKPKPGPTLLPVSAVGGAIPLKGGDVLYPNVSFVDPASWFRFSPKTKKTTRQAISTKTPVDLSGVTVIREMATSKDGTMVPVNILLPRGTTPGSEIPFILTGYGGYGVNIEPGFQATKSVVLERGVGVAIANLRGGAEFGDAWHTAGALENKQHVFDDFIAVSEHLLKAKHAATGKLAITGGSNGGLLMGAAFTQRPELYAAVASFVGIYDMMRVETEPNGAFNTTEFGTVTNEGQFKALLAYSPYHHVKAGTAYPPTLFLVGANDVRVAPWHSRKMVASLQAATSSATAPILLMTSFDAGHGIGSSLDQTIAQNTDAYAFMLRALGVPLAH